MHSFFQLGSAAIEEFGAVLFMSLAGLDLNLWFLSQDFFAGMAEIFEML